MYPRAVKIVNRKVRLLVQIERKRVSSKAAASWYLWSRKFRTSVGFIDFETGRKDRRSGPRRFFFVTAARKSTQPGARSRCVFDRLSDRRGHSAFQLWNKYRRREIGEEGTGKKTSSKEPFSIGDLDSDRRNESHSRERPGRSGNNATYESMKRIIDPDLGPGYGDRWNFENTLFQQRRVSRQVRSITSE